MKKIIAVIGNANIDDNKDKQKISFELGKLIIDNNFILATGGLGGVMEFASQGARSSKKYKNNSIIGVLPDYHLDNANKYIDIALPTGFGLARNLMLVSMSSAIIAVGGGSGTLNEISASWQMNKLIIALEVDGWSKELCGKSLDKRRDDIIFCASNAKEAIELLNKEILNYQTKFTGVSKTRIKKDDVKDIINNHFKVENELIFLGKGSEGFVFSDKLYVFKLIDNVKQPLELSWVLSSLSEILQFEDKITAIPEFEVAYVDGHILIKYEYFETSEFKSEYIHINKFIDLLKQFAKIKWVVVDFQPKNLRLTKEGDLLMIDIGRSFLPTSSSLFKSMCRRAFVSYKLQDKLSNPQDFKRYLSPVNKVADFSLMKDFDFLESSLKEEFDDFYKKVMIVDKKDILNPIIKDIFQQQIQVKSVFDYGSGYGDMAMLLKSINLDVVAYEPDKEVVKKNKKKYYSDISVLNHSETKQLITKNIKFDSVLCSLVLCHLLAKSKEERLEIINQIMTDIRELSNKYIVIVICNPLYTHQTCSTLQKRILPDNFQYKDETEFTKKIYSSGRERFDIHRPLSFYENLFDYHNLNIKEIIQTNDIKNANSVSNSDFMIFILEKHKQNE